MSAVRGDKRPGRGQPGTVGQEVRLSPGVSQWPGACSLELEIALRHILVCQGKIIMGHVAIVKMTILS